MQSVVDNTGVLAKSILPPPWQQRLYLRTRMFRRTLGPFLFLNMLMYLTCFSVFILFTVNIVTDYREVRKNPRTTINVTNEPTQLFPGMLLCNNAPNVGISLLGAYSVPQAFYSGLLDYQDSFNITNDVELVTFNCGASGTDKVNCIKYSLELPAFAFVTKDGEVCGGANQLSFFLNVNGDEYPNFVAAIGTTVLLSSQEEIDSVDICDRQLCSIEEGADLECPTRSDALQPGLDSFLASPGGVTTVTLEKSITQDPSLCGRENRWGPVASVGVPNPRFIEEFLGEEASFLSTVQIQLFFRSTFVREVSSSSQSFASVISGIAGWFGFLSDGWGILTLAFIIEKLYIQIKRHPWRKWYERIDPTVLGEKYVEEAKYTNYPMTSL